MFVNRLQFGLSLCLLVIRDLSGLQVLLLNEEILFLCQFVEKLSQIGPLLRCNLCRGGIGGSGAVSEREDVIRTDNTEMSINGQATAICLRGGELSHQVLRQCSEG